MARIRGLEAGTRSIFSAIALATTIFLGAGLAQAADSSDRITPPNPNDVAILRGLLALQHPALRQGAPAAAQAAPTVLPAVTTEPNSPNQDGKQATEGEACASPASGGRANCGSEAEASASRAGDFRASLDRAMAAAGYDGARL